MRVLSKLGRSVTALGGSSPCFSSTPTSSKLFVGGVCRQTAADKLERGIFTFWTACGRTIEEAEKARDGMNAKFLDGWVIFVHPARERVRRPPQECAQDSSDTGFRTSKTIGWYR